MSALPFVDQLFLWISVANLGVIAVACALRLLWPAAAEHSRG